MAPIRILVVAAVLGAVTGLAASQPISSLGRVLDDLLPHKPADVQLRALKTLDAGTDRAAVPALIELLRFELDVPAELHVAVLERLAGERFGRDWARWVEWLQKHPEVRPHPESLAWKWRLFTLIDAEFGVWFQSGTRHRIRIEEIGASSSPAPTRTALSARASSPTARMAPTPRAPGPSSSSPGPSASRSMRWTRGIPKPDTSRA
jgi:hypothetical protein